MVFLIESLIVWRRVKEFSNESLFTLEPLYIQHLGISEFVKQYKVNYLLSDKFRTVGERNGRKAFAKTRTRVFPGFKHFSSAIESSEKIPGTLVDF